QAIGCNDLGISDVAVCVGVHVNDVLNGRIEEYHLIVLECVIPSRCATAKCDSSVLWIGESKRGGRAAWRCNYYGSIDYGEVHGLERQLPRYRNDDIAMIQGLVLDKRSDLVNERHHFFRWATGSLTRTSSKVRMSGGLGWVLATTTSLISVSTRTTLRSSSTAAAMKWSETVSGLRPLSGEANS